MQWGLEEGEVKLIPAKEEESCDYCIAQEAGKHYCLLHTREVKNMNTVRCRDWVDVETGRAANEREGA